MFEVDSTTPARIRKAGAAVLRCQNELRRWPFKTRLMHNLHVSLVTGIDAEGPINIQYHHRLFTTAEHRTARILWIFGDDADNSEGRLSFVGLRVLWRSRTFLLEVES